MEYRIVEYKNNTFEPQFKCLFWWVNLCSVRFDSLVGAQKILKNIKEKGNVVQCHY